MNKSYSNTLISFKKVSLYRENSLILKDVDFEVNKGDFFFIIGKVGEGKSTLIKSMIADVPVNNGDAVVCGYNLVKIKSNQIPYLRRKVGIVFQDFKLLTDRDAKENLAFVLKSTGWSSKKLIYKKIDEVLSRTGLETKGFKMPHQLSGGEQQRLAVARALLNDPVIILADEPTGNLDPDSSYEVMDILSELQQEGKAVVIATHNYNLLKRYPYPTYRCAKCALSLAQNYDNDAGFNELIREFSTEFSQESFNRTDTNTHKEPWEDFTLQ